MPESAQSEPPGRHFVDLWSPGQKVLKPSILEVILSTSGANARECSNRASWASFCRLLKPMPESAQIEPPGRHFVDFWSQCQKVLKSSILGVILSTSEAKARKCSNRASWTSVCRLVKPRPESLLPSIFYLLSCTKANNTCFYAFAIHNCHLTRRFYHLGIHKRHFT